MENFVSSLNLNKIKQPAPDIAGSNEQKRTINRPYVGVISDINPTSTPIRDTLTLKEQENPRIKYMPFKNKNTRVSFDNIATSGIIGCGILAILSLIKRKK